MGYMFIFCTCVSCGAAMMANPRLVPCIRVNNNKEPICLHCVRIIQKKQRELGMDVFTIPDGAYEPVNEQEIL